MVFDHFAASLTLCVRACVHVHARVCIAHVCMHAMA